VKDTTRATSTPGKRPAKPKRPKRPLTRKQKIVRVLMWIGLVVVSLVLVAVAGVVVVYEKTSIPDPNAAFRTETSFVYYANGKSEIGDFALQNRVSIPYSEMPKDIKQAVVAAENRTFWTDPGIDFKSIIRAVLNNSQGQSIQGASTITQEYVKVLYLNEERTYSRKVKEAILALKLSHKMSKQQILEGYLNTIYFGRGAYGIQAAAEAYFNEPASALNLRQAAVLASILNNPYGLDPANGKDAVAALTQRYDYVLSGMAQMGDITQAEATKAQKRLPVFPKIKVSNTYGGQRGHMLALVKNELLKLGFTESQIEGGGLRVTTTLTRKDMAAARQGVMEERPTGFSDKQLHIGVALDQVGTGALLGFYGGQNYLESEINWAASGGQIGSSMKPVTLATALEAGYSLTSTFDGNSPYVFPGGLEVHNEGENEGTPNGDSYGSNVTALYGLEQSINTVYVDMTHSIPNGSRKIYRNALKMGMPPNKANPQYPGIPDSSVDLDPTDALITLGKARISPINLANTYATIANGGRRADVHVISKVTDASGKLLYQFQDATTQAIPGPISDDVSYAMQQVVKSGTGTAALALGRPAAGKTGTANNAKGGVSSAWFSGFTPQIACSVMYLRGNGVESLDGWLPSYFGADYPARTWTAVMEKAEAGLPVAQFPPPANVSGTPPETGHESYPSTSTSPSKTPSKKPSHTASRQPSEPPSSTATSPSDEPTESTQPSDSTGASDTP